MHYFYFLLLTFETIGYAMDLSKEAIVDVLFVSLLLIQCPSSFPYNDISSFSI